jgi:Cof subfamily protein (haloacid dehalogenase superfamily)
MNTIVCDLDGTLLRSDKTLSHETLEILETCQQRGHQLIIATARPPRDAYKYLPAELSDCIISCYNGALVLQSGEILYRQGISKASVLSIAALADQKIGLEIDDVLYTNFEAETAYGWSCQKVDFVKLEFDEALKIIICEPSVVSPLPSEVTAVLTDNGELCQMMHKSVSKYASVKRFSQAPMIAFGDDQNDLTLLSNAEISVAMDNATDEIKVIADYTTLSNDQEGVAKFLKEKLL